MLYKKNKIIKKLLRVGFLLLVGASTGNFAAVMLEESEMRAAVKAGDLVEVQELVFRVGEELMFDF